MSGNHIRYGLYRSIWAILDLLFPPVCGGCGGSGGRWCDTCKQKVQILNGVVCDVCGLPQKVTGVCSACMTERPSFRALRAWAVFDDPLRKALHKLKYRRDVSLGDALALQMIPFVAGLDWPVNVVVPIPLGHKRYKERGYNQVAMIAKPLALALGLEYSPRALHRQKETRSQVGLTRSERRENVYGAFSTDHRTIAGKTVLIMDDVSTTGSTLSSAADVLLLSGAKDVYALTVARALPHHGLKQA